MSQNFMKISFPMSQNSGAKRLIRPKKDKTAQKYGNKLDPSLSYLV